MTRPWLGPGTTTAAIEVLWRQAGVGRLCSPVPGQAGRGGLAPVASRLAGGLEWDHLPDERSRPSDIRVIISAYRAENISDDRLYNDFVCMGREPGDGTCACGMPSYVVIGCLRRGALSADASQPEGGGARGMRDRRDGCLPSRGDRHKKPTRPGCPRHRTSSAGS